MNLGQKRYLLITVLHELWLENPINTFELPIQKLKKYFTFIELKSLLEDLSKNSLVELLYVPPIEILSIADTRDSALFRFSFTDKSEDTFERLINSQGYKNFLSSVANSEAEKIEWPEEYKWLDSKVYYAGKKVRFNGIHSQLYKVFKNLVDAKGSWVTSQDLVANANLRDATILRLVIRDMRKRSISHSGIVVESRRSKPSSYRVIPTTFQAPI